MSEMQKIVIMGRAHTPKSAWVKIYEPLTSPSSSETETNKLIIILRIIIKK